MNFNTPIDRRGTNSSKWDMMERLYGVSPDDGLAMWTADSDFATAPCVIDAVHEAAEHGNFGYVYEYPTYFESDPVVDENAPPMAGRNRLDPDVARVGQRNCHVSGCLERAGRRGRDLFAGVSRICRQNKKDRSQSRGMPAGPRGRHLCSGSGRRAKPFERVGKTPDLVFTAKPVWPGLDNRMNCALSLNLPRATI